jgi:uncharacterized protein YbjQ (UPF0145 family)
MNIRPALTITVIILLTSCTNIIRTSEDSEVIRLYFLKHVIDKSVITDFEKDCSYIGEVIGSEGHWYTYLFISNSNLTQGALNDMKNKTLALGANTVIVHDYISSFATSVTFLGQAYNCSS